MRTALQRRQHKQTGFSLIEVIIILAVLVTLIALLVPSTVQQLTAARRNGTLDEMDALRTAMIGDPNLKSQGVRSDFAYLGDMGNLPSNLDDLLTQGAQPAYAFDSSKRVGAGWKGPYVTVGAGADSASHKRDAFGNDYTYDTTDYTNGQGQAVDGKLVTLGADGVAGGTGVDEDVTLEVLKAETTATVNGFVFDGGSAPAVGIDMSINYSANGALTSSSATTDATGFYQFTNIPFGMRSVEVAPRLSLVPGSVSAFGAQNANVQFSVVNSASSAVTVRFIIATYSVSVFYNDVTWQGTTVWSCSGLPQGSGSTTILSPDQTVAAGGGGSPTVIAVASSVTQVADITLAGGGSQAQIRLLDFRSNGGSCSSGSRVGMNGVNFTDVQLRDPSNAIVGQFSFTVP